MKSTATTIEDYFESLPEDRKHAMRKLHKTIVENLPPGFDVTMAYGMIGYVVPHSTYPPGYHCDPKLRLPFINIASQKNFVALYHMGMYSCTPLLTWFTEQYPLHTKAKLDMGKSCVRFKRLDEIPYDLIGELASKLSPEQWIEIYESQLKKK